MALYNMANHQIPSDGHRFPFRMGFHGDHIPFLVDCLHRIRADFVLGEHRVQLGGGCGWRLAKDNDLSTGSLQQEVSELSLCRVDHCYSVHLHQPMRSRHTYTNIRKHFKEV